MVITAEFLLPFLFVPTGVFLSSITLYFIYTRIGEVFCSPDGISDKTKWFPAWKFVLYFILGITPIVLILVIW